MDACVKIDTYFDNMIAIFLRERGEEPVLSIYVRVKVKWCRYVAAVEGGGKGVGAVVIPSLKEVIHLNRTKVGVPFAVHIPMNSVPGSVERDSDLIF